MGQVKHAHTHTLSLTEEAKFGWTMFKVCHYSVFFFFFFFFLNKLSEFIVMLVEILYDRLKILDLFLSDFVGSIFSFD